jgi:hypothetical protein
MATKQVYYRRVRKLRPPQRGGLFRALLGIRSVSKKDTPFGGVLTLETYGIKLLYYFENPATQDFQSTIFHKKCPSLDYIPNAILNFLSVLCLLDVSLTIIAVGAAHRAVIVLSGK